MGVLEMVHTYFLMPSRQGVYTPSRAVPTLSQHELCMHGKPLGSHSRDRPGLWPPASTVCRHPEGSLQAERTSVPAPKAHADAGKAMHAAKDPVW